MSLNRSDTTSVLWTEGSSIKTTFDRVDDTNGTINWTIPDSYSVYDGVVITISSVELTNNEAPVDGTAYTSSQDLNAPADVIGNAQVVGAFYGDKLTTSVNVINLNPNSVYFVAVYEVTNTLYYYTPGSLSYVREPSSDTYEGNIPSADIAPTDPSLGEVYFNSSAQKVYMWNGASWVVANSSEVRTGKSLPSNANEGDFFYNTGNKILYVYSGTWTPANTTNTGTPMYDRHGIGSDGTTDEYEWLATTLKRKMGWPTMCVELDEQSFYTAINNAIQEFRRRADNAYRHEYLFLPLLPNQGVYYLNDPETGTDRVSEVIKVYRMNPVDISTYGSNAIWAQQFLTQLYHTGSVDFLSMHLVAQMGETMQQILAGYIQFGWNEATRELSIYRNITSSTEKVLVEVAAERTKQELLNDRYAHPWIEDWAFSEVQYMLGMIRGKFASLPGAGGGTQLNGAELIAEANTRFEELRRQIMDFEVGNGGAEFGNYSFCIG